MIDPALLRPGRLDKAILCDVPDEQDRISIIEAVSKTIPLSDVSFEKIAAKTKGFTGADLQGLLYTAQLQAINERMEYTTMTETVAQDQIHPTIIQGNLSLSTVQEKLNVLLETKVETKTNHAVIVTMKHVESALKQSKPSLRAEEYLKFKHKYQQFLGEEAVPVGIKSSFQ
jgi:peroxin-1